jgi:hypothetical protein
MAPDGVNRGGARCRGTACRALRSHREMAEGGVAPLHVNVAVNVNDMAANAPRPAVSSIQRLVLCEGTCAPTTGTIGRLLWQVARPRAPATEGTWTTGRVRLDRGLHSRSVRVRTTKASSPL